MCMLTSFGPGVVTDGEGIFNGALSNDDGHGWAIVVGRGNSRHIQVGHGMRADNVVDDFLAARAKNPNGPALFHSRWATHGEIGEPNCHPFLVGGDPRIVLAHNGILPAKAHPLKGDDRSDTRKFAESILPKWGSLDSRSNRKRIEKWLGHNKVLVLSVHPNSKHESYLFGEHLGNVDKTEGVWYSNHDWLWAPKVKAPIPAWNWGHTVGAPEIGTSVPSILEGTRWDDEYQRDQDCRDCGAYASVSKALLMCRICYTCQDCGGEVNMKGLPDPENGECSCMIPANLLDAELNTLDR